MLKTKWQKSINVYFLGDCDPAACSPQLPHCSEVVKREYLISHKCKASFHSSIENSQLSILSRLATREAGGVRPRCSPHAAGRVHALRAARVPLLSGFLPYSSHLEVKGRALMQTHNHLLRLILPIRCVIFILPGNCCPSALRKTAFYRSDTCQLLFTVWRDVGWWLHAGVWGWGKLWG